MKKGIVSYDITSNKYRNELSKILKVYGKRSKPDDYISKITCVCPK